MLRILLIVLTALSLSSSALATEFSSQIGLLSLINLNQPSNTPVLIASRDWVFGDLESGFAGRTISTRLLLWSLPWMGASILGLTLSTDEKTKGFWSMSGAWGFINSAIAMIGFLTPEPELENLRNLLLINAGVDVLYIATGVFMLTRAESFWQGAGLGVVIQGTFLLIFDLWQGLTIRF
jgi:hypothetical protein